MDDEIPSERSVWLWPEKPDGHHGSFRPWLDPYLIPTDQPLGAVLVCPGGGYGRRAPHEGITVAQRFNAAGFHAFVLHYRVAPARHPAPLRDASRAIRLIRQRATEWKVRPDRIAVLGFSAGGHLAGSLGVLYHLEEARDTGPLGGIPNRPDALVLCYPVILDGEHAHRGSLDNLLGPEAPPERRAAFSLERRVTAETPPTFLWHTADDAAVPVENSLLFARALRAKGVPFELHVYPKGRHGLGLAGDEAPHVASWFDLCCRWLRSMDWGVAGAVNEGGPKSP